MSVVIANYNYQEVVVKFLKPKKEININEGIE